MTWVTFLRGDVDGRHTTQVIDPAILDDQAALASLCDVMAERLNDHPLWVKWTLDRRPIFDPATPEAAAVLLPDLSR